MTWREVESVIYYLSPDFKFNPTVALFNFTGTLIISKTFPDIELVYKYDVVKSKLLNITKQGASIIIYQSFYRDDIDNIKKLFELLLKDLKIPIVAFFSTKKNKYSKPFTNMWKLIELFYQKEKKVVKKDLSIVVGHKAGRINMLGKKNIDYSCIDRAFAFNIGIKFLTPERFFQNYTKISICEYSKDIINQQSRKIEALNSMKTHSPIIIDELYLLPKSEKYTVMIVGPPSCGKTTLAKKINQKWIIDYKIGKVSHVSENSFETFEELQNSINQQLIDEKSVIVDLLCNMTNITKIIKTSMTNHAPILIIEIKVSERIVKLLDFIKVQTSKTYKTIVYSKKQWKDYYKQYKKPVFADIPCVKYVSFPLNIQLSDEYWYEYSY